MGTIENLLSYRNYTLTYVSYVTRVGRSPKLQLDKMITTAPSSPPENICLVQDPSKGKVKLAWDAPSHIANGLTKANLTYRVTISSEKNPCKKIETINTEIEIDDLNPATGYNYSISAYLDNAESERASDQLYTSPNPPKIKIQPSDVGTKSIRLTWSGPDKIATGATIERFTIHYFLSGKESDANGNSGYWEDVAADETSLLVSNLAPGLSYMFKAMVHTTKGNSAYSNGHEETTHHNETDLEQLQRVLEEEVSNLRGELQGAIDGVQGDLVDMQNANSALCAYQYRVGYGKNGLSGKIVVYDTTYLETNGASCSLDKSTGKFTAGKSGVYQISVSASNGYTYEDYSFEVYLRTSSGKYQDDYEAEIAHQRGSSYYLYSPVNAIRFISLQQGETAWLEYDCSLYRSNFSTAEASMESDSDCYIENLKFCVSLYK